MGKPSGNGSDVPRTGRFGLVPPVVTQQLEAGVGRAAEFADVARELQEEALCLCVFIHWMPRIAEILLEMTKTPQVEVGVGLPRVTPDATVSALKRDVNVSCECPVTQSPPCPVVMLMQLLIPAKASSPHEEIRQQSLLPCWVLVNISLLMYY